MRSSLIGIALFVAAAPGFAQEASCGNIKGDKQRLACYDKANAEARKAASTAVAAAPAVNAAEKREGEVFKSGTWHVHMAKDAMTDKTSCTSLYRGAWTIQGTADTMFVSFRGRGGIRAYTLRVDDDPADQLRLASNMEKKLSAADLQHSFERIYQSKRVRLQVSTVLETLLVEDIDMKGFKETTDYIRQNCTA